MVGEKEQIVYRFIQGCLQMQMFFASGSAVLTLLGINGEE